jgi:hypothetical protein
MPRTHRSRSGSLQRIAGTCVPPVDSVVVHSLLIVLPVRKVIGVADAAENPSQKYHDMLITVNYHDMRRIGI